MANLEEISEFITTITEFTKCIEKDEFKKFRNRFTVHMPASYELNYNTIYNHCLESIQTYKYWKTYKAMIDEVIEQSHDDYIDNSSDEIVNLIRLIKFTYKFFDTTNIRAIINDIKACIFAIRLNFDHFTREMIEESSLLWGPTIIDLGKKESKIYHLIEQSQFLSVAIIFNSIPNVIDVAKNIDQWVMHNIQGDCDLLADLLTTKQSELVKKLSSVMIELKQSRLSETERLGFEFVEQLTQLRKEELLSYEFYFLE